MASPASSFYGVFRFLTLLPRKWIALRLTAQNSAASCSIASSNRPSVVQRKAQCTMGESMHDITQYVTEYNEESPHQNKEHERAMLLVFSVHLRAENPLHQYK